MIIFNIFLGMLIAWSVYMLTKKDYKKIEKIMIIVVYVLEMLMTIWIIHYNYVQSQRPPRWACSSAHACECKGTTCDCKYYDERNEIEIDIVCPNNQMELKEIK